MTFLLAVLCLVLLLAAWNVFAWPRPAPRPAPAGLPLSVLVPARNEERRIGPLLDALAALPDRPSEILVYDDHSEDGTAARVLERAARDARFRLVRPVELERGWYGKPFACRRLAGEARGRWLLFLDADTRPAPGALAALVAEAETRGVSLLSAWPGLDRGSAAEELLMPMLNFVVFTLFPAPLALRSARPSLGLAHGACLLARRDAYRATGGHDLVRAELFEDTLLARRWREAGQGSACVDGSRLVRVRMYDSAAAAWAGFTKNFYPAFRRETSFWLFWAFHFACFLAPFAVAPAAALGGGGAPAAWGGVAAVLAVRVLQARRFGYAAWSVAAHPVAEGALLAVGLASWYRCRMGGGVEWKGRRYRPRHGPGEA